jgi:hypothetical protein
VASPFAPDTGSTSLSRLIFIFRRGMGIVLLLITPHAPHRIPPRSKAAERNPHKKHRRARALPTRITMEIQLRRTNIVKHSGPVVRSFIAHDSLHPCFDAWIFNLSAQRNSEASHFQNESSNRKNIPRCRKHLPFHSMALHAVAIICGAGVYFLPQFSISKKMLGATSPEGNFNAR